MKNRTTRSLDCNYNIPTRKRSKNRRQVSANFKLQVYLRALLRHWLEREPFLLLKLKL